MPYYSCRQIKLNPHTTVGQEIEPAPHRWKASALTTAIATNPAPLSDHKYIMIRMLKYEQLILIVFKNIASKVIQSYAHRLMIQ